MSPKLNPAGTGTGTKDPFTLEFLAIDGDAAERQLEDRPVKRIIDTLRELGSGFAFVGARTTSMSKAMMSLSHSHLGMPDGYDEFRSPYWMVALGEQNDPTSHGKIALVMGVTPCTSSRPGSAVAHRSGPAVRARVQEWGRASPAAAGDCR
ncbi:PDDEXK nuclease domain-containing protein [Rhodococcus sp. T2V]|uniref:PDDEXK nuclease domain-containing protein n=1 Tax=Rhodococcus sp. T2V TaxID=3034164 RepID=UPI0023E34003|nr:PDDEXK nuclease domain-containing protein [Rhodococcus sp. T2V]MDF3308870.1 PDDEXK nuclease domain-containing protein [Rhodococcus sp. T2V]